MAFLNSTDFVVMWEHYRSFEERGLFGRRFRITPDRRFCGDTAGVDLILTAVFALGVLRSAVGLVACEPCSCDADGSGEVGVADARAVLLRALGLEAPDACPVCAPS